MPKIAGKPKKDFISVRVDQKDIDALDKFYKEWQTTSLHQIRTKRAGVVRLAFEDFIKRYDLKEAYNFGNYYSVRVNAHEFKPDDMFALFENLKELKDKADTKGEKYLYSVFYELLDAYRTDVSNYGSLKDTYYQQTQRLFVNQWQIKEDVKEEKEGK